MAVKKVFITEAGHTRLVLNPHLSTTRLSRATRNHFERVKHHGGNTFIYKKFGMVLSQKQYNRPHWLPFYIFACYLIYRGIIA